LKGSKKVRDHENALELEHLGAAQKMIDGHFPLPMLQLNRDSSVMVDSSSSNGDSTSE
jgi:hypothetical protein